MRRVELTRFRVREWAEHTRLKRAGNPAVSFFISLHTLRDFNGTQPFATENDFLQFAEPRIAELSA